MTDVTEVQQKEMIEEEKIIMICLKNGFSYFFLF